MSDGADGNMSMEALVADKLAKYGVDERIGSAGSVRSVSIVDPETGRVSRPGTGTEASPLPPSRPGSKDGEAQSLRGILRSSSSDGDLRRLQQESLMPRPPSSSRPRRSSGGSRPLSNSGRPGSRPRSGDPPQRVLHPPLAAGDQDAGDDAFAKGVGRKSELAKLEPLAGFGVDVSTVNEEESFDPEMSQTFLEGERSVLLTGSNISFAGGESVLVFDDAGEMSAGGGEGKDFKDAVVEAGQATVVHRRTVDSDDEHDETAAAAAAAAVAKPEPAEILERKIIRVLRFVSWFHAMGMSELRDIARGGLPIKYPKGCTIVQQGDDGDSMFVVLQGTVHLEAELIEGATVRAQKHQACTLEEGDSWGEGAIVWVEPDESGGAEDEAAEEHHRWWALDAVSDGWDYTQREATAVAETDCIVIELPRRSLRTRLGADSAVLPEMRRLYEATRAATVVQRKYRSYAAGKDAAKKMADMLARAAADMANELKSLTPHAQAYMAMMGTLSHAAVGELQAISTPPPLRRPAGYVSRSQEVALAGTSQGTRSARHTRGGVGEGGSRGASRPGTEEESRRSFSGVGGEGGTSALVTSVGNGRTISPVVEGEEVCADHAGGGESQAEDVAEESVVTWAADGAIGSDAEMLPVGEGELRAAASDGPKAHVGRAGLAGFATWVSGFLRGLSSKAMQPQDEAGVDVGAAPVLREQADENEAAAAPTRERSRTPKSALRRPGTQGSAATASSGGAGALTWQERNWTLLLVTVIQCQELPRRNYRGALGGPVDATLEVSVDEVRYTIPEPVKRSCAPYFNEQFVFQLPEPEDHVPEPEHVKIEVVDAGYRRKEGGVNKKRRRGDSLGLVFVPIAGRGEEGWYYLQVSALILRMRACWCLLCVPA